VIRARRIESSSTDLQGQPNNAHLPHTKQKTEPCSLVPKTAVSVLVGVYKKNCGIGLVLKTVKNSMLQ